MMACLETPLANGDSEMEEGEIVDEADDLSDISSEEEFLLRQRLQVLENYNNVLERKEAKRTSIGSDQYGADGDNGFTKVTLRISRTKKPVKQHKQKKSRITKEGTKIKEHKRKNHHVKKKITIISDSETSDISEDEYRNKRRRLENAVCLSNIKHDTSTLKDRISKMLCGSKAEVSNIEVGCEITESSEITKNKTPEIENSKEEPNVDECKKNNSSESVHIFTDENVSKLEKITQNVVDSVFIENKEDVHSDYNSDEDLELLRQLALKTKTVKIAMQNDQMSTANKATILSEDEDSDTAELRMICLKSAFLKKAIEIKQKQKQQKRLSQSSIVADEFDMEGPDHDTNVDNNTDIESVDMDIGSDAEVKGKIINESMPKNVMKSNNIHDNKLVTDNNLFKDDLEDDEDLLRAKLLTSLSKNLPNLVKVNDIDTVLAKPVSKSEITAKVQTQPEEKKFIIKLGESDSEGENEATKNLTKMHIKLSEQQEFQNKLDLFLKSTRMEVEKSKTTDVVHKTGEKVPEKLVIKAMNHLPKSEQIEYKNLVKRMAELEKLKQARQNAVINKMPVVKETLKPRNMSLEAYKIAYAKKIEDKIAQSRKNIAEKSEKILRLKEEATKLSQRYKIVATELRNIGTAITMNKKQQKLMQIGLSKIRHQHQMLIKSSPTKHSSNQYVHYGGQPDKTISTTKLQKENDPCSEEHKNLAVLKSVKVSVVNNLSSENIQSENIHPRLSVQVDISSNKKVVKLPKSPIKDRVVDIKKTTITKTHVSEFKNEEIVDMAAKKIDTSRSNNDTESCNVIPSDLNDYKSPLDSLQHRNWEEDPNGFLCPFEVGGSCRDTDCKYLHPKPHKSE